MSPYGENDHATRLAGTSNDLAMPGPVVQPLPPRPGAEHGVVGSGTFTNPALLAPLRADPAAYYVNVHSSVCPSGVIRGQFR